MVDITPVNPITIPMVSRDHRDLFMSEKARQRQMRVDNAFKCAGDYHAKYWAFANALREVDVNQDWKHYMNAEQTGKCKSFWEWLCANQEKLNVSPSWAMFMAGQPQMRQEIIYQLPQGDVAGQEEAWQIINQADPSRLQVAQGLLNKQLKKAQQTSGRERQEAVQAIQTTLHVIRDARTRNDVIEHVKQVGSGIIERTVHFRVGDLEQKVRGKLDISDLPAEAFVAATIWYNPAKQREYQGEAHELEKRRQTHRTTQRGAYLFWQGHRKHQASGASQRLVQAAGDAIAQSEAPENQA